MIPPWESNDPDTLRCGVPLFPDTCFTSTIEQLQSLENTIRPFPAIHPATFRFTMGKILHPGNGTVSEHAFAPNQSCQELHVEVEIVSHSNGAFSCRRDRAIEFLLDRILRHNYRRSPPSPDVVIPAFKRPAPVYVDRPQNCVSPEMLTQGRLMHQINCRKKSPTASRH